VPFIGKQLEDVRSQQLTPLLTAGHIDWQSESEWHWIEHIEPPELFPPELLGLLPPELVPPDPSSPVMLGLPDELGPVVASPRL
jgi:hypothetical protein